MSVQKVFLLWFSSLVTISGLVSCNKGRSSQTDEAENIRGTSVAVSEEFGGGRLYGIIDGYLLTAGGYPEYSYTFSALRNDSVVPEFNLLRNGNGPGEVMFHNTDMAVSDKGRIIAVSNKSGGWFSVDEFIKHGNQFETVPLSKGDEEMKDILWVLGGFVLENDSTILGIMTRRSEAAPDNFFARYDFRNRRYEKIAWFFDDDEDRNREPFSRFCAYADNSRLHSNGRGKYAYVSGNERHSFIFTLAGNKINIESKLYDDPIKYDARPGDSYKCEHSGYEIKSSANNRHIYLFHRDRDKTGKHDDDSPLMNQYGDKVEVFDWDGKLQRTLILDHPGFAIMADSDDSALYLFSTDPETGEYIVWKYRL